VESRCVSLATTVDLRRPWGRGRVELCHVGKGEESHTTPPTHPQETAVVALLKEICRMRPEVEMTRRGKRSSGDRRHAPRCEHERGRSKLWGPPPWDELAPTSVASELGSSGEEPSSRTRPRRTCTREGGEEICRPTTGDGDNNDVKP
jgi:hypothetical protein